MAKMTPEQEAAYALRWGLARNDLPPEAQLAYDRLTEQQARAAASAPIRPAAAGAASSPVILPGWAAAVGTVLVFLIAQGTAVVLLPYAFTHWQPGTPPWPVAVRAIGVALIVAGGIMVIWGFVRFATEGAGIPVPTEPTSRQLTVGGRYRYLRNPLFLAIALVISGQGLLLSRPVLLVYDTYRSQVPGWWPPSATPQAPTARSRWRRIRDSNP